MEREHANAALTEQIQHLTDELHLRQDEFQHLQKSSHKQVTQSFKGYPVKNGEIFY